MNALDLSDLPFLLALPALLVVSGFFSGSETALFALRGQHRARLLQRHGAVGHAVGQLLASPRMLLITVLFGNMCVNVVYFVISSMLLIQLGRSHVHPLLLTVSAALPVVAIILFGELLPKMLANLSPARWVQYTCLALLTIHRLLTPLRLVLDRWIITPLARLVGPTGRPADLNEQELARLVEMSRHRNIIDPDEQSLIHELVQLGRLKVRDVMVPRVDIHWIDITSPATVVTEVIRRTRVKRLPVCRGNLDHVLGLVYSRQYLLAARQGPVDLDRLTRQVHFVPEQQRVDQMLAEFRRTGAHLAIVVDEYGGTAGLVSLKDVVERIVGDLDMDQAPGEGDQPLAEPLGPGIWRLSGRLPVHDWLECFPTAPVPPRVATVGGLVQALRQACPAVGDTVRLGNLELTVEAMAGRRVESVIVRLAQPPRPATEPHPRPTERS